MKKIRFISMGLGMLLLPYFALAQAVYYDCSCIGWQADRQYHPCIELNKKNKNYKIGTNLKEVGVKEITNLLTKQRLSYISKGAAYEPSTGWYCSEVVKSQ